VLSRLLPMLCLAWPRGPRNGRVFVVDQQARSSMVIMSMTDGEG